MNKQRRKALEEIHDTLNDLIQTLVCIKDEEEEAVENKPESLRTDEKIVEILESAVESAEDAFSLIEYALNCK